MINASPISFSYSPHPEWNEKITAGLLEECKNLTGSLKSFETHAIYAQHEGAFIGGITFEPHGTILWIDSIWIEPKFRHQGLGKQLIEKATLCAVQAHMKEVQLNTYFETAHTFFLTCGFTDVATIPQWKWGLTCYLMRKCV
jgi:N-acetylglutamate synthase-like GNAT family acetyltransferase